MAVVVLSASFKTMAKKSHVRKYSAIKYPILFAFHTVTDHVFLFGKNASHATHTLFCILIPTLDQGYTVSSNFKIPSEEVGI